MLNSPYPKTLFLKKRKEKKGGGGYMDMFAHVRCSLVRKSRVSLLRVPLGKNAQRTIVYVQIGF